MVETARRRSAQREGGVEGTAGNEGRDAMSADAQTLRMSPHARALWLTGPGRAEIGAALALPDPPPCPAPKAPRPGVS